MSLTSYRAAPSRVNRTRPHEPNKFNIVNGLNPLPAKPGGVLLFQRLSGSTIGAVWFHVRVRDGIGWGTDAMATKQWSRRKVGLIDAPCWVCIWLDDRPPDEAFGRLVVDGGIHQA